MKEIEAIKYYCRRLAGIGRSVTTYLTKERYRFETAAGFNQAELKVIDFQYDCILVDIDLPRGSGLELIKLIKKMKRSDGIIVISANSELDDRLVGLKSINCNLIYRLSRCFLIELHFRN